jgi:hypothetical protein
MRNDSSSSSSSSLAKILVAGKMRMVDRNQALIVFCVSHLVLFPHFSFSTEYVRTA